MVTMQVKQTHSLFVLCLLLREDLYCGFVLTVCLVNERGGGLSQLWSKNCQRLYFYLLTTSKQSKHL